MRLNRAPELIEQFRKEVEQTRTERFRVRGLVSMGLGVEAERDDVRAGDYIARQIELTLPGREAMKGPSADLQSAWFLVRGYEVRRAVAYVDAKSGTVHSSGTGFLISPELFLTNQHVIPDLDSARASRITFGHELDVRGLPLERTIFDLDPGKLAIFSHETELDYALIAVGPRVFGSANLSELGYCPLSNTPDRHAIGMPINIIQHPRGWPKMIALRNGHLSVRTPRTLLYDTDTDEGSSGAPVFNDSWEVVALHHYGEPFLERHDESGKPIPVTVNEGIRISAIYEHLQGKLKDLSGQARALLEKALNAHVQEPQEGGKRLTPPRPGRGESLPAQQPAIHASEGTVMTKSGNEQEIRVTIPLDVTIRVGGATAGGAAATSPAGPALRRPGAEAVRVDQNYDKRKGYDEKFIPGVTIPLPEPDSKLAKDVAPLNPGEPRAKDGELKYEHFSVKLNKNKKIAIFTATNIDGKTFLTVDRDTGEVVNGAEGDKWFIDPRINAAFYLGQPFYTEWSHLFDRGHLTRRNDPNWGKPEVAERANADTFHFTNCSPQHWRFNQTARFWQGAERFVLENGVLATSSKTRISVFQGPIFDDAVDHSAEGVQIPSSYFKVIVWKGKSGLKSVGLIVDQSPLFGETRIKMKPPSDIPAVDVNQWRVPIRSIESRTGLSFGRAVLDADTIKQEKQPSVGEALIRVAKMSDLLPSTLA